jgi:hypothetical protein
MTAEPIFASEARVTTAMAQRYLGQLCKHFQHKLPVSFDPTHGSIAFPTGTCTLDAANGSGTLVMRVETAEEAALGNLEGVVARHLERFAFRDTPAILWTRVH